ncbi:glycine-rich domain-containing protein [Nodularia chucula]|uniref:glycine-rich domain-containing protein n=1 Tax=Nodularia chucula TaxID=3093667 RepID=UPI0039C622C2
MLVEQRVSSTERLTFLQKLEVLDLEPIAFLLMHPEKGCGWTREQTVRALKQYVIFLFLMYVYPHNKIIPTQEIDAVWHSHLLDTAKYKEDCQMLFGRFINHFPYAGLMDEVDRNDWEVAFAETQVLFAEHFEFDGLVNWVSPSGCQPLKQQKQLRPRVVNIKADVMATLPWSALQCG